MSNLIDSRFTWTPEAVEKLKALAAEGLTRSQISGKLGVTRNAVCGKINRLNLAVVNDAPGTKPLPEKKQAKQVAVPQRAGSKFNINPTELRGESLPAPKPPDLTIMKGSKFCALPESKLVRLMDVTADECRWPIGTVGSDEFRFCGAPVACRSYCCTHGLMSSAYSASGGQSKYDVMVKAEQADVSA